jgi:uncharacterized protein (TIGR02001 family)
MRKSILGLSALSLFALATPALAQDEAESSVKITGNVALVSDYRFRGFSQSTENAAVQGGLTVTHDSGFYASVWASSINLKSSTGADLPTEMDLIAGYSKEVTPGITADVGVLYYLYPKHGGGNTDFFEPYVNLTGAVGPAVLKVGANFAWKQDALIDGAGNKASAIYLHAEPSFAIPNTPISLDGHIGYAESNAFPGGYGNDHHVWDYSIGGQVVYKNLAFGVHYVTTDEARYRPSGTGAEAVGADGAAIFSLTASF